MLLSLHVAATPHLVPQFTEPALALAIARDAPIAVADGNTLTVWDLVSQRIRAHVASPTAARLRRLAVSPDGTRLAVADRSAVYSVDADSGVVVARYALAGDEVFLAFRDNNTLLASRGGTLFECVGRDARIVASGLCTNCANGAMARNGRWLVHFGPNAQLLLVDLNAQRPAAPATLGLANWDDSLGVFGTEAAPEVFVFGKKGLSVLGAAGTRQAPLPKDFYWSENIPLEQTAMWQAQGHTFVAARATVFDYDGRSLQALTRKMDFRQKARAYRSDTQQLVLSSEQYALAFYSVDAFRNTATDVDATLPPSPESVVAPLEARAPTLQVIGKEWRLAQRGGIGARVVDLATSQELMPGVLLPPLQNLASSQGVTFSPSGRYALFFAGRAKAFDASWTGPSY